MNLTDVTGQLGSHVRDAVVITEAEPVDLPGPRMVWVNDAFTQMTGYTRQEAIGQTPRLLQGPDTAPDVRARIRASLKAWRPIREVLKNYTKDGDPFWVELDIKPIADTNGWYHYWVAVQRDVTEHVLAARQLDEARAAAEAANRLKSEFLANMSHEIRTPLNGVLGMAQVLTLTDLNARQRSAVETIISSGTSLLGLIEDVLDLSKIEAGQLALEPLPVTPKSLIEDAGQAVKGVALQKGLHLDICAGTGSETACLLDPRRVRQILINLTGNATKFTDRGKVMITSAIEDGKVVFEVRDSGPGIAEDKREIVFERFRQADSSHARHHSGAGLGLAIVKDLVDALEGEVSIGTAPEGGALIRVTLPFIPVKSPVMATGGGSDRAQTLASTRTALLVEDNAINREVVCETLRLNGWQVDVAERAADGLEAWRKGQPDLIIMDRQMPGLSGEDAVARLRAEEADTGRARTPILMLTAHALAGAAESAKAIGVDAYMVKPFKIDALITLADTLTGRSAQDGTD
jgi:PAS domain S-box-containing protein